MKKFNIKTGSSVKVICGSHRNVIDTIKKVDRKKSVVYLENFSKIRFVKNSDSKNRTKKVFIPIDISNVRFWKEDGKGT